MKRALVLAAGGVTGALYEVGVLRAVEERHGPLHQLFDLFIGVSAGATVAAFVSQGVSPARLHAALLAGGDPLFPLRQRDIAAMDLRRAARLGGTAARFAVNAFVRLLRGRSAAPLGLAGTRDARPPDRSHRARSSGRDPLSREPDEPRRAAGDPRGRVRASPGCPGQTGARRGGGLSTSTEDGRGRSLPTGERP